MFSASKAAAVAVVALAFAGCAATTNHEEGASVTDLDRGRAVYAGNCAVCHGATGTEGGIGPSLRNLKDRMDQSATESWIRDPQPPMPKLYPKFLTGDDVRDVATYVDGL